MSVHHKIGAFAKSHPFLYDPKTSGYLPVFDHTKQSAEASTHHEIDKEEHAAFSRRRPIRKLKKQNETALNVLDFAAANAVVPHVSLGDFYREGTLPFQHETILHNFIIAPVTVGGDNASYLYLTGTNRSLTGTESLIAYNGQSPAEFRIWEWAIPHSGFVLAKSFEDLHPYYDTVTLNGSTFSGIYVVNSTRMIDAGHAVNDVFIRRAHSPQFDCVYTFEYALPAAPDPTLGFWGPIVETFQSFNSPLNTVGFAKALLIQDGITRNLNDGNVQFTGVGAGLSTIFRVPDSDFLVR